MIDIFLKPKKDLGFRYLWPKVKPVNCSLVGNQSRCLLLAVLIKVSVAAYISALMRNDAGTVNMIM